MDEAKREYICAWLKIARRDLEAARILGANALYGTAAFHCQQAAEKAIKGFLVYHDQEFGMTHNIGELVQSAGPFESQFAAFHDAAQCLTRYAEDACDTDILRVIPQQEFDQASQSASDIYTFVLSVLPSETHPI